MHVTLTINDTKQRFELDPRVTLLDAIRHHAGLTGTEEGLRSWPVRGLHGDG